MKERELSSRTAPSTILNFAYGSNMLTRRLQERAPSAVPVATGIVRGHALRWHKVGQDLSGKCDIFATGNDEDVVHGVVYRLLAHDKPALDAAEGLGAGYDEKEVEIETDNGPLRARVYYATRIDPGAVPFAWYKALVVAGAQQHALPPAYVARLRAVTAAADPDHARTAKHERLINAE